MPASADGTRGLELLRGMARGEAPLSRAMAARILEEFASGAADAPGDEADAAEGLTLREEEVLELVAQRHTNKEIAQRLVISEYTVKNHLSNILCKLHLRSRAEAARMQLPYAVGRTTTDSRVGRGAVVLRRQPE